METGAEPIQARDGAGRDPRLGRTRSRFMWRRTSGEPTSMTVQLAVGSAAVALAAILVVALTALLTVAISFSSFQRSQLAAGVAQLATTYGEQQQFPPSVQPLGTEIKVPGTLETRPRYSGAYIWLMDASGRIFTEPPGYQEGTAQFQADEASVTQGLLLALHGTTSENTMQKGTFAPLADRLYAAAPIWLHGAANGKIIGAVALSTPPRSEHAGVFTFLGDVNTTLLAATLGTALLAAVAAILFSRRLTRPLAHLTDATARMASGDYSARVKVSAPAEVQRLASSFNDMAAALERDVRELRWQGQLRRELVANVSHELATPLTAIEGFTEALRDDVVRDPAARQDTVRTIAREAARLHRLVDQLRQVVLVEADAHTLDRAPLSLAPLVEETLAVLAPEMEAKGVTVVNTVVAGLPAVYADGDRVTEILLNLLDNALRHAPTDGHIEVTGDVGVGSVVWIGVANDGPTIPVPLRERIFERFYRLDASRSTDAGGTGLGLAIVKELVEAHGGVARVEDRAGSGVCFRFSLPVVMAAQ
ncbi:MAG TPA: HAMP domain-containing sensor histidine kinase [Ktedonobacterales bacterium]|nr:HAMP domain-containing sensor histidine kinase [Ktedonobacterales bacterium]